MTQGPLAPWGTARRGAILVGIIPGRVSRGRLTGGAMGVALDNLHVVYRVLRGRNAMSARKIEAGSAFPRYTLPKVGGGMLELGRPQGENDWQMVVVYRGKHCPLCKIYLDKLEDIKGKMAELKIDVVTVSGDPQEKAERQVAEGNLTIPCAYGLSIEQMQSLGLYISRPRPPKETDRPFPEPGLFVVNAEGNVQVVDISNAPL